VIHIRCVIINVYFVIIQSHTTFFNIFIAPTVYTTHRRKSYKIVSLINLNGYLHNDSIGTEVDLCVSENNSSVN
jgi:hypothetical protein